VAARDDAHLRGRALGSIFLVWACAADAVLGALLLCYAVWLATRMEWHPAVSEAQENLTGLRKYLTQPVFIAAIAVLGSTCLPWVTGSAVGIALPEYVWQWPWGRWILAGAPILLTMLGAVPPRYAGRSLNVVLAILFYLTSLLGCFAWLVESSVADVTKWAFLGDTLLRGIDRPELVIPVVRVGYGAQTYALAAFGGVVAVVLRLRRRSAETLSKVPEEPLLDLEEPAVEMPKSDGNRFVPGDSWWS
jgi:hypothetical protein